MMSLQHERLVKFIGAGKMFDAKNQGYVVFSVVEYMAGGALDSKFWGTPFESVAWTERLQWATDIAAAMLFIHSRGFSHRSVKVAKR